MNTRQIIAKNTLLQMFLLFFNLSVGFYSIALIARYLGKTTFGKYGFVSSFYFFFIAFLDFGVSAIAIREVARERNKATSLLSNILTFKLFLAIPLAFIAVIIANTFPFPPDLRLALSLYAPILLLIAAESIQIIFEADLRYEYIVLSSFFWKISLLLFLIFTIKFNLGLSFIVISFVLAEAVKYIILYFSSRKFVNIKFPAADIRLWIGVVKKAFPMGITAILTAAIRNIDVMMLTKMKGFAEVGLYTASYRLCDISLSLPIALIVSTFPLMSKFYRDDPGALKNIYQKTFDILSVCGLLLVVLVLMLADKIIILLFGPSFVRSALSLRILIFSVFFVYLAIGSGSLLIVTDKQKINMWLYLIGALLNISLNLILIPHFGFIGAAICNVIVMFVIMSLTFYFVNIKLKMSLKTTKVKKAIIASLATLIALLYLKNFNLFVSLSIGIVLYIVLGTLLRIIDRDDIVSLIKREI